MAKAVQLHDAPICKRGLPEYPKFIIRTEYVRYGRCRSWKALWLCKCGSEFEANVVNVTRGHTTSCGCAQNAARRLSFPRHGHFVGDRPSPTYKSWQAMIARCINKNHVHFRHYGGRGIKICDRWINSFDNFLLDMGDRPAGKTLDRVNVNGDYGPENCRWATISEQNKNKRPRSELG